MTERAQGEHGRSAAGGRKRASATPRARKRFAQHFLEAVWVRKVADAIAPAAADVFLEIGPGTGALTSALAGRGAQVLAVEIDRDLVARLRTAASPGVRVVEGDILRVDLRALADQALAAASTGQAGTVRSVQPTGPGPARRLRIVGNLPYNISSPVLFRLMALVSGTDLVADATLMLQEEVAERVVAPAGTRDYGPLSILVQMRADARRLLVLPPGAFRPPPRVRSALVSLVFRGPRVAVTDERLFAAMVRAVFTQRRKTLTNALRPFASVHGHQAGAVLAGAGIDGGRRPETLTLAELARLAAALRPVDPTAVL